IETLVEPAVDSVLDAPRLSPDGRRLAYLRHHGGRWRLVVRDLESDLKGDLKSAGERELGGPGLGALAWPAWSPDGFWIVLTVAEGDTVRLEAWPSSSGGGRRVLETSGGLTMAAAFDERTHGEISLV